VNQTTRQIKTPALGTVIAFLLLHCGYITFVKAVQSNNHSESGANYVMNSTSAASGRGPASGASSVLTSSSSNDSAVLPFQEDERNVRPPVVRTVPASTNSFCLPVDVMSQIIMHLPFDSMSSAILVSKAWRDWAQPMRSIPEMRLNLWAMRRSMKTSSLGAAEFRNLLTMVSELPARGVYIGLVGLVALQSCLRPAYWSEAFDTLLHIASSLPLNERRIDSAMCASPIPAGLFAR